MPRRNRTVLILAFVAAILAIGVAVWFTQFRTETEIPFENPNDDKDALNNIRAIRGDDHVRGNPEAKLVYLVYTDFGCPYCKDYHLTMNKIMDQYGRAGNVAWVFRHMPIVQLHPQANMYALASECVAKNGGNQAFWKFADLLFEKKTPENEVSANELVALAKESGVDEQSFASCMGSDELQKRITDDFDEARAAGIQGTPYTVIITERQRVSFAGVRQYAALAKATETILRTIGVTSIERPDASTSASEQFTKDLKQSPDNRSQESNNTVSTSTQAPTSTVQ